MKLDPGMHIGLQLVFFGKTGVTHQLEKYCTFKTMSCRNPKICKMSKGVSKIIP
jgi:hypothetical protein